jgi:flagellar motor protein MotB
VFGGEPNVEPIPDFEPKTPVTNNAVNEETKFEDPFAVKETVDNNVVKEEDNIEEKAEKETFSKETIVEEKKEEEINSVDIQEKDSVAGEVEKEPVEVSDLKKKFDKLFGDIKEVYSLKNITDESLFDVVGSDNDTVRVVYSFGLETDGIDVVVVKKKEVNMKTNEEKEDLLEIEFDEDEEGIQLYLNDDLLFDEQKDLDSNVKQKMQVMEKMDKFIFFDRWIFKKIETRIGR